MSTGTKSKTKSVRDVALGVTALGALLLAGAAILGSLYAAALFIERYAIRPDFSGGQRQIPTLFEVRNSHD
jgi:hypothetical protein